MVTSLLFLLLRRHLRRIRSRCLLGTLTRLKQEEEPPYRNPSPPDTPILYPKMSHSPRRSFKGKGHRYSVGSYENWVITLGTKNTYAMLSSFPSHTRLWTTKTNARSILSATTATDSLINPPELNIFNTLSWYHNWSRTFMTCTGSVVKAGEPW